MSTKVTVVKDKEEAQTRFIQKYDGELMYRVGLSGGGRFFVRDGFRYTIQRKYQDRRRMLCKRVRDMHFHTEDQDGRLKPLFGDECECYSSFLDDIEKAFPVCHDPWSDMGPWVFFIDGGYKLTEKKFYTAAECLGLGLKTFRWYDCHYTPEFVERYMRIMQEEGVLGDCGFVSG